MSQMDARITDEDLPGHIFQETDAVFVCDRTDVRSLQNRVDPSFQRCRIFALTVDALGAAYRTGHGRIVPPYDWADYKTATEKDYPDAARWACRWLSDFGLGFDMAGLDFEKFDVLNQYLFFRRVAYFHNITKNIIESFKDIGCAYVVETDPFLPQDFYFDSDVAAEAIKFACESLNIPVKTIALRSRPLLFGKQRPYIRDAVGANAFDQTIPGQPVHRVGIVPMAVSNVDRFFEGLGSLVLYRFETLWNSSVTPQTRRFNENDLARLNEALRTLTGTWEAFASARRSQPSSLPDYIIKNDGLLAQFEYIIRVRWLAYARYLIDAQAIVRSNPLDLLLYCDHFFAEGVILAHLYRQCGTKVVAITHSPDGVCEGPYAVWDRADAVIVQTRRGADRLRAISEIRDIPVSGIPQPPTDEAASARLKQLLLGPGDTRRIVTLVDNCFEVGVPLVDVKAHFETLAVLASPPPHLADKVVVLIRMKPSLLTGDPILFSKVLGFSDDSINKLNGLTFSQCLSVSDCAVTVNSATSGFIEAILSDVPMVCARTAAADHVFALGLDYYCPPVRLLTDKNDIWPEIERVLFDATYRKDVLAEQKAYMTATTAADFPNEKEPLRPIIQRYLQPDRP